MTGTLSNGTFFGRVARARTIGDLVLSETRYAPGFLVPEHAHENPFFCFAIRGTFTECFERSREVIGPTTLFFHPAGADHAEEFHERRGHLFNVQLGAGWLARLDQFRLGPPEEQKAFRADRINQIATRLFREYRTPDDASALIIDGFVLAMLGEVLRAEHTPERGKPPWLTRIIEILHDRFRETVTLAQLAGEIGVDPIQLSRTFRAHYGCTIGEYSRRLRARRAMQLLAEGKESLSAIAYILGFADQSHFCKVFKKGTGFTPGGYRRHAAEA